MVNKREASGPVVPKGKGEVFTAGIQLASAASVDILYVAPAVKKKKKKSSGESDLQSWCKS